MTDVRTFAAGDVFERSHPFTFVKENGSYPGDEIERWRPGAWNSEYDDADKGTAYCTALGAVRFMVISTHRPPGYPERVFFKREFTTPDGERYASGRLMNCITRKFRKDIAAFPFPFEVEQPDLSLGKTKA